MKVKLTDDAIRKLTTAKKQEDVFHVRTPSAGVRLTKEGRKTFFLLYRSPTARGKDGRPQLRRYYLGEHPAGKLGEPRYLSLKQFETEFSILRGKLAQGLDPQAVTVQETGLPPKVVAAELLAEDLREIFPEGIVEGTVGALLADFLTATKGQRRARTYRNYRRIARTHILPRHARTPLALFAEEDVRALLSEIALDKEAPTSAREVKKVLGCAFSWGKTHVPGVRVNPAHGIRLSLSKPRRDRWLTDEELVRFFRTLPELGDPIAADLYLLVLASLCRPGEAFSMRAEDVTTINEERVWKLADTKNGRDFLIPLQGLIGEVVARRSAAVGGKGSLFWEYKAESQNYPHQLSQATQELRRLSGLPRLRPHDLRRTGRTHLRSLGVRDEVAEAALNHAQEDLKQTYNLYSYWSERKAALALWHEKLATLRTRAGIQSCWDSNSLLGGERSSGGECESARD